VERWFALLTEKQLRRGVHRSTKELETLGSYRDCPGRRGRIEPGSFGRGSFDRIVCTEPLAFAADAVIYLWDFNGRQMRGVGFA
jgi:hypothetical protein